MTEDEANGQYIGKSLAAPQDKRNKLDARRQIDEILYSRNLNTYTLNIRYIKKST